MISEEAWAIFRQFEPSAEDLAKLREELMKLDPVVLRAYIRYSAHRIDNGMQRYIIAPKETKVRMRRGMNLLRTGLKAWEGKGYDSNKQDIKYAYAALKRGEEFEKTPIYNPSPAHKPFNERDSKVLEKAMVERRSIRRFSSREVPDNSLDRVLEAATRAPCACSLQGCRFIVVKEVEKKRLIIQPWGAPIIILGGIDKRPYEFIKDNELPYNPYIDLGAAIQNMLLMAHALGLGTCPGTFTGELDVVRRALKVPDYIKLITYFALGWPEDKPTTVPRMELEQFVSRDA